jgi:hypothetical protein
MADANAPEKNWWRWFEKDTLISIVSALGLDVIFELIKKEGPVVAWTHFKKDLDEKILTDKRAEMLREFRKMEDAGTNIDNLRRRHAESMDRSKVDRWAEYRFVQLLCKIQPPDPANPQKVRPPIVPGKPGKPQNDRQADLKWLNDQGDPGDPRFDQMMHFLDHDVVTQMFQIGCDRTARFLKNLRDNLKVGRANVAQWLRRHFGALGDWIVDTAEATLDLIVRFFRWLSGSWLRVAAIAVISLPILIFVALIVRPIRRRVFPWLGIAMGVLLVTLAYYLLVPTSLDKTLSLAFLMLLAAAFFLWKFAPVRNTIFVLLAVFTLIFFFGGRTAARNKIGNVFAATGQWQQNKSFTPSPKPTPGTIMIEAPLASGRQTDPQDPDARAVTVEKVTEETTPADTGKPAGHCGTFDNKDSATFQYGDIQIVLLHCFVAGTQIRFSGYVKWVGEGTHLWALHRFRVSDSIGTTYEVQSGRFDKSNGFGTGYFAYVLSPKIPVAFSFVAGTVDSKSLPETINLILPNTQVENGDIQFTDLMEKTD